MGRRKAGSPGGNQSGFLGSRNTRSRMQSTGLSSMRAAMIWRRASASGVTMEYAGAKENTKAILQYIQMNTGKISGSGLKFGRLKDAPSLSSGKTGTSTIPISRLWGYAGSRRGHTQTGWLRSLANLFGCQQRRSGRRQPGSSRTYRKMALRTTGLKRI